MSEPFGDDELRAAVARAGGPDAQHRADCPSPDALLAAIRGEGPEAERLDVLDRALRCAACRREMALLHAVSGSAAPARALPSAWRRFAPVALAATLLLAVGIVARTQWRQPDDTTRDVGSDLPALIAPAASAVADTGLVTFVWRPVPGALRYTLEILSANGGILFTGATADTVLVARMDTLARGEQRWWVQARMDDGTSHHSVIRPLRLR
jgi:hypothetical protein